MIYNLKNFQYNNHNDIFGAVSLSRFTEMIKTHFNESFFYPSLKLNIKPKMLIIIEHIENIIVMIIIG